MITLYIFGPGFGLPDPSPFVMKAEMLLKLAGLPYHSDSAGFSKAPKGKLPYSPVFETPVRAAAERHDNLKRYVGRMTARFYPDIREIAGCQAAA